MGQEPEKREDITVLEARFEKKDTWEKVGFARPLAEFLPYTWQAWGASGLAVGVIALICWLYLLLAWNPFATAVGYLVAGIISVVFALTLLLFVFFAMYSLFGGWDNFSLAELRRAMEMSGPSKPFVKLINKLSELFTRNSSLHNRFPIRSDEARQEAVELMIIKDQKELEQAAVKVN